jgi:beta-lactam-binding protein with PASTA domain
MASIVTITPTAESVACTPGGSAEHSFTITNTTGAPIGVGATIVTADPSRKAWFTIQGAPERRLAPNETDQVTVAVKPPAGVAPGTYKLRLQVFSSERGRASEDFTDGPTVAVVVRPGDGDGGSDGRSRWWIVAVVGVVALLVVGGLGTWLLWPPRTPEVPDLAGQTLKEAQSELEAVGLQVGKTTKEMTGKAEEGQVIVQTPEPGTSLEKGGTVDLVLEAASVEVPDVLGKKVVEAQEALNSAGLAVGPIEEQRTGGAAGGTVLGQEPSKGQRVAPQSAVALTVEAASIPVPRLIGQTLAEATRTLRARGLVVGAVTQRRTGGTPGAVLSQSPAEGQQVAPGRAVNLAIEQQKATVPQLQGLALQAAMGRISAAGLKGGTVTKAREGKAPGTVIRQNPGAGAKVAAGSAVALVIQDQPLPACRWTRPVSEESPSSETCPSGFALKGIKCSGRYCDNKALYCCPYLTGADGQRRLSWSGWISEESPHNSAKTRSGFVGGLQCKGRYCDNIRLQYLSTPSLRNSGRCSDQPFVSEEGSARSVCAGYGTFVAGMSCKGRYCDNVSLECCGSDLGR